MKVQSAACPRAITAPRIVSASLGALLCALTLSAGLAGCGGSSGGGGSGSGSSPGQFLKNPATDTYFVTEDNQGGSATSIKITSVEWGRLVDIYDFDPLTQASVLVFKDTLIRDSIQNNNEFTLDRNPITGQETLTILHPFGSGPFKVAFNTATHLQPVLTKGLDPGELPPFTALPRNGALVIVFNDLIKTSTISAETVRVATGYAPNVPFEARVLPDLSHGDRDGSTFYSTRVIVDMTTSQFEASQTNPPPQVNTLGLPAALIVTQPNLAIRLPTKKNPAFGQFDLLTNLTDHPVSFTGNGPNDAFSPTLDVVRSLRSMSSLLADPNNGFLPDKISPEIVGVQPVTVTGVTPNGLPNFLIDVLFANPVCALTLKPGYILALGGGVIAEVTAISQSPAGGFIANVQVRQVTGSAAAFIPGQGQITSTWDQTSGSPAACFVRFSPAPGVPPDQNVPTQSTVTVFFSEPIDPGSVQAFDTFRIKRAAPQPSTLEVNIVGSVIPSLDLQSYTFAPSLPLTHVQGVSEGYQFDVVGGPNGIVDLAGNPLAVDLPQFTFSTNPAEVTQNTGGISLTFSAVDEDVPVVGGSQLSFATPEVGGGQQLYDIPQGVLLARPVGHFSATVEAVPSNPVVYAMTPFSQGLQTPLSNLGSKMMGVWRYCDLGFGLQDPTYFNIDVESLAWAPFSPVVQVDQFPQFRLALATSKYLPDEGINTATNTVMWPNSGLVLTFNNNLIDPTNDPLKITSPKDDGYVVNPAETFSANSGLVLQPWPMNQNKPPSQFTYYTWRDTALLAKGAPGGQGAELLAVVQATQTGTAGKPYPVNQVPSIGLPLLMEFRCYPNDASLGLNGFKVAFAVNNSIAPYFRAFSTGGVLLSGQIVQIDRTTSLRDAAASIRRRARALRPWTTRSTSARPTSSCASAASSRSGSTPAPPTRPTSIRWSSRRRRTSRPAPRWCSRSAAPPTSRLRRRVATTAAT
jgi:hypothetical protein